MNPNDDVVYRCLRFGPLRQLHPGRSRRLVRYNDCLHGIVSFVIYLFGGNIAGSVDAPAIHKMPGSVELVSAICAVCTDRAPLSLMDRDRSGRGCSRIDALRVVIKQYQDCRF
jgi:hypothetical protein